MPERNVELLATTMQHIVDHPENHRQESWVGRDPVCGTVACFAGHAALLAGWSIDQVADQNMWNMGAKLLGLTFHEASTLFSPGNTQRMLELMVNDLVNGDALRDQYDYFEVDHA